MMTIRVKVKTTFDKRSDLEMTDFINNLKESFENVIIISIENIKQGYDKHFPYEYRVLFYHDLKLKINM